MTKGPYFKDGQCTMSLVYLNVVSRKKQICQFKGEVQCDCIAGLTQGVLKEQCGVIQSIALLFEDTKCCL